MSERCPKCEADFYCGATDSDSHCDYWHCRSVRRIFNGGSSHFTQTDRCQVRCLTATLTARESELAEAQRRVAELEKLKSSITWVRREIELHARETTDFQMSAAYHHALEITRVLIDPDRITHIPGKESDDGEMH